LFSLTL
jgi:hypothetical protein